MDGLSIMANCECAVLFVGQKFSSFCGGSFGRDGYGLKTVVAYGATWITVVYDTGVADTCNFDTHEKMIKSVCEWKEEDKKEDEDDPYDLHGS